MTKRKPRPTPLPGRACAKPTRRNPDGRTGTTAGYLAHRKACEAPCDPCKEAEAARWAARPAIRRDTRTEEYAAYRRALGEYRERVRAGEQLPVCAKPTCGSPDGRTGTRTGYMAHMYAAEQACDACREGNRTQVAADRIADPDKNLSGNLWRKYRLRLEGYREILAAQGGRCAICGAESPGDIRLDRFHVDHDHSCCPGDESCGECVRGLLCRGCNTALGNFGDDPDRLIAAAAYLLSTRNVLAEVLDGQS